ncbi:hypothetical protein ACT474_001020 [Cronobacter malonaticus]
MISNIKRYIIFFYLLIFSFGTLASSMDAIYKYKENSRWPYFFVSKGDGDSINSKIGDFFNGKELIFKSGVFSVTDSCAYNYHAQIFTSVSFWGSSKTVDYYKSFFSNYKISIPHEFIIVTPVNPSEKCEFPFTEFIILNDVVVFFYKSSVVFYFKTHEALIYHQSKDKITKKTHDSSAVKECKEIKKDDANYNTFTECFFKGMNVALTYETYYKQLNPSDKTKLLAEIDVGRDETKKLGSVTVTVSYKWLGTNELVVTQQYDGGLTTLHFIQETNGTKLIRELSPD